MAAVTGRGASSVPSSAHRRHRDFGKTSVLQPCSLKIGSAFFLDVSVNSTGLPSLVRLRALVPVQSAGPQAAPRRPDRDPTSARRNDRESKHAVRGDGPSGRRPIPNGGRVQCNKARERNRDGLRLRRLHPVEARQDRSKAQAHRR